MWSSLALPLLLMCTSGQQSQSHTQSGLSRLRYLWFHKESGAEKWPHLWQISDVEQIMGLMHVEAVQIQAEAYDVALDVSFPRGELDCAGCVTNCVRSHGAPVQAQTEGWTSSA